MAPLTKSVQLLFLSLCTIMIMTVLVAVGEHQASRACTVPCRTLPYRTLPYRMLFLSRYR